MYNVKIKTTHDYDDNFVLTNAIVPNGWCSIPKLLDVSIINTTNVDVSVVDYNGVCSSHSTIRLDSSFYKKLSSPAGTEAVYIIERRVITPSDLINSLRLESVAKPTKHTISTMVFTKLPEVKPVKMKEVYVIHEISLEHLKGSRHVYVAPLRLYVSLSGYEKYDDSLLSIERKAMTTTPLDNTLFNTITYYSNDPNDYIYVNMLGTAVRVDSKPIKYPIVEECVLLSLDEANVVHERIIRAKEFRDNNIFYTKAEAEKNMHKDTIVQERKLNLELKSLESKVAMTILTDLTSTNKMRAEIMKLKVSSSSELAKIRQMKEKENKKCAHIDAVKKYFDFISLIVKLVV